MGRTKRHEHTQTPRAAPPSSQSDPMDDFLQSPLGHNHEVHGSKMAPVSPAASNSSEHEQPTSRNQKVGGEDGH
ncbi:Hypothetical predicted protein [Pelobates cultripes]|uniref:Uncharacterized protein n=1 Tax=Pelobates cultripes TaxID=61616 RepID=A0AAD1THT5_PELCU|nr:Hypothetical predicted protein [Pelobates cultripes]